MLKNVKSANLVALVGRKRHPMREKQYPCHAPEIADSSAILRATPSEQQAQIVVLPCAA
jgi:hypothetical protein